MPTLAIAGGTSAGLGRAIVTAVISSEQSSWNIVILSRNPSAPLWLRAIDKDGTSAQIHPVNYHCVDSLAAALNGVHTVVSVTSAVDGSQAKIQINLLEAAVKAGCKRFAPSQWGFGPIGSENISVLKWGNEGVWDACVKQKDKIESAKFNIGSFRTISATEYTQFHRQLVTRRRRFDSWQLGKVMPQAKTKRARVCSGKEI